MSGKYEEERKYEVKIQNRLKDAPAVINEYYYSLIGAGKSYATAYCYINYVLTFIDYTFKGKVNENFYTSVKSVHINKYISSLRTKDVNGKAEKTSDSIRSVQWSALNSFFQFLVPDYLSSNPVANTQRPKMKDKPNVTYLTKDEISRLLNHVENTAQDKFKQRDLCLLKLGFSTGLRVSAIVQIDIDDIDFKHNCIRVTEKGDHDVQVMFGDNLKTQILQCLEDRKEYLDKDKSNALFLSQTGNRLSQRMVEVLIAEYAAAITDKHVTPHVMRHSCATNLYEATGDIYLCSKQLNHKQVSTTQRYAELSKEKQKKAANILDGMI